MHPNRAIQVFQTSCGLWSDILFVLMSCIQLTTVQPTSCTYAIANQIRYDSSAPCIFSLQRPRIQKVSMNLAASSSSYLGLQIRAKPWKLTPITSGCKQSTPVCIFGGGGKSENDAKVKVLLVYLFLVRDRFIFFYRVRNGALCNLFKFFCLLKLISFLLPSIIISETSLLKVGSQLAEKLISFINFPYVLS